MNKHQQIREILKQGNEKAEPKNFKLHIGDHIISDRTWVSVQNSVENEVLDLWMKTPKPRLPTFSVKNVDSDTEKESAFDHDADEDYGVDEPLAAAANKKFASLEYVPVVSAFLTWRLLDEFGEEDDSSDEIKATRFLNAIYRNLPAVCVVDGAASSPTMQHAEQNARTGPSTRSKIILEGKTRLEVRELVHNVGREPSIKQKVFWECIKLFEFFLPSCHDRKMAPIQLFWGALYELLVIMLYSHHNHEANIIVVGS